MALTVSVIPLGLLRMRVSALDGGAALVSKTLPQPQSDSDITLHARSPSLKGSLFSRVRDSAGGSV